MKMRLFFLTLSLMFAVTLQTQTYNRLWKNVEQMKQKDLPKSVIAEAEKIYAKAKQERNAPQMMKAYLTMMVYRESISPDSLTVDLKGLEAWADSPETETPDRAVLYSILGEMTIEDDFEKGNRYLHLSLKDSMSLVDYPAEKLVPMVETGETSRLYFDDNLYDLLARRAVRLWEQNRWNSRREDTRKTIQDTYQSLLHIYKVKGMRSAWLLTALDAYPQADEKQLREWMKEYADLDVCAEVYLRLAQQMMREDNPAGRLALLREGISRYPEYNRINALKNEEQEILAPRLNMSVDYAYPGNPIPVQVNHCNLKGLTVEVYWLDLSPASASLPKVEPKNVKKYGKLLRQEHFELPATSDYRNRTDTLEMKPLDTGVYYWVAIPDGHRDKGTGRVLYNTGLQVLHRTLPGNRLETVVLDKQSGYPVSGAQVFVYQVEGEGYGLKDTYDVNDEGVVVLDKNKPHQIFLHAQTMTDKAMPIVRIWQGGDRYQTADRDEEHIRIFTDRSLYRPGQTLHYAGIVYRQRKDELQAKEGWSKTITLCDAEGREVTKQEVTTDAFGTFQGMFELPKSGKLGVYRLQTNGGMASFRVEEYKRPTFDVKFDTVRTSYRAGDSIRVTGMARTFSGAPVQGAKVRYAVLRLENNFWRMRGVETHRVTGETTTDAEGRFEVPVHFLPVEEDVRSWYYTYEVSADVTNLAGETQEGVLNLPLGSTSMRLFIPEWDGTTLIKEEPDRKLTFEVCNLADMPIRTEVSYQVLSQGKAVLRGKSMSNQAFVPEGLEALPSGCYQLKAMLKDGQGKVVERTVSFSLLSLNDKRLPEGLDSWCYQTGTEFDADGTVTVYFGSRDKDVYLFCDLMYGDNHMEQQRMVFSDSLMAFRYTYKEEYGDGLRCNFAYLKDGELHTRSLYIEKPKPDKALTLKWKTFRDKLRPGQQERWTLSILRPDGQPADAQLMATMYDASLDRLKAFDWHFSLMFERFIPNIAWVQSHLPKLYWGFWFAPKHLHVNPLTYSRLDMPYYAPSMVFFEEEIVPAKGAVLMKSASVNRSMMSSDRVQEDSAIEEPVDVQLRTNFAETAFFYPQLRTDADGEVCIEFTLPESLTEWKFMGLAHTRDMDYGSITAKAVATKEFMIQPNLPRFVRVGDEVSVAASLVNLSDKYIKGTARMELLEPETEKVILTRKCPFAIKAGETGQVSFAFGVDDKYEGLVIRMVADGGTFSDGEQRYLPVLSNKQKLTESVLLDVNGAGSYTFSLEELFNHHSKTVSRPKMVVEFTGNPLWYAVQALKVVSKPEGDNAFSWASAYYANALLKHLAETEPRIADSLKVEGVDAMLAESELKMKDLQNADGSWSWYKGMGGNLYMTTSIAQLLVRLQRMTGSLGDAEMNGVYREAMVYLDKQAAEEVRRMKEAEKKGRVKLKPSEWALQYLYLIGLEARQDTEVGKYLLKKLAKMSGDLTIYGKAVGAILLQQSGEVAQAKEFLQSLMEYSVMTESMGRYFDTPKAEYSWLSYKIPTQVMAIEAVRLVANEEKTQEEMKQWLLKQKQAQVWETPIATTDAVYALLTTGKDWMQHTGAAEIIVGKETIHTPADDALAYVRKEIGGKVMDVRQVTVKKESAGIGWGAVYAEFEEEMDKASAQGNALKVTRMMEKDGKPLAEGTMLAVGDKLKLKLLMTADRDMDFVEVKDERAACMEPADALSGYRWADGIGYYQQTKDASTSFFMDKVRKGTYELEYEVYVTSAGRYTQGIPVVRSVYAPEFGGHGIGGSLFVK